jgi:hypothetical protein
MLRIEGPTWCVGAVWRHYNGITVLVKAAPLYKKIFGHMTAKQVVQMLNAKVAANLGWRYQWLDC